MTVLRRAPSTGAELPPSGGGFALRFLRKVLTGSVAAAALLALASCYRSGPPVMGVAQGNAWFSLPFEDFLHEGDTAPEAMSFCAGAQCPAQLAVAILTVTGDSARQLERILQKPDLLRAEMDARAGKPTLKRAIARDSRTHIATALTITPFDHAPARGFILEMSRKDGKGRIAATVLGWKAGETLKLIIAIGKDREAAREAALRAVEHNR